MAPPRFLLCELCISSREQPLACDHTYPPPDALRRPSPSSRRPHLSDRRLIRGSPTFENRLCEPGAQCSIESPCTRECAMLHDPSLQREAPESSACPMPMSTLSVLAQSFALLSHSFHRRLTFAPILVVLCSPACRPMLDCGRSSRLRDTQQHLWLRLPAEPSRDDRRRHKSGRSRYVGAAFMSAPRPM